MSKVSELLLLMAFVLTVTVAVLTSGEIAGKPAAPPLPATVTVEVPNRLLPAGMAEHEVRIDVLEPLPFADIVARVAELVGFEAVIEERPGRVFRGGAVLDPPVPFGLAMTGTLPAVLDELARMSGYDWTWSGGRLAFFRYGDIEQRAGERLPGGIVVDLLAAVAKGEAEELAAQVEGALELDGGLDPASRTAGEASGAVAALEGQAAPAEGEPGWSAPPVWEVDPDRYQTVEGVLHAWAGRVGWRVAWQSERQFQLGAGAVFDGAEDEQEGFLKAADALLAVAPMRRSLAATVYPNRWLVIRDIRGEAR